MALEHGNEVFVPDLVRPSACSIAHHLPRATGRGITKTVGLGLAQSHFDGAESHSPACQWDSGLMVDIKVGFGATRLDGQFACSYRHQLCEDHDQLCWSPPLVLWWWRAERSGRQVQQ